MDGFSFIQITDHHLPENESDLVLGYSPAYALRAVLRHIAQNTAWRADFIISTGDLVDPATTIAYQNLHQMLDLQLAPAPPGPGLVTIEGLQGYPVYFMPGNHDQRHLFLQHLFSGAHQTSLVNATIQHKGVQLICLDMGANAKATLYDETLDFLTQAMSAEMRVIIVTHHHVVPIGSRWLDEFIADGIQDFWELLTRPEFRPKIMGVISAHTHITYEKIVSGIPVFGLRSTGIPFAHLDEPLFTLQPPHYRLFRVQDGLLTTRLFEVPL